MTMANIGAHIMPALNPAHLTDGAGNYFVSSKILIFNTAYKSRSTEFISRKGSQLLNRRKSLNLKGHFSFSENSMRSQKT